MHRLHRIRSRRGILITGAFVALLAFPIGVIASHQFTDVPDAYLFHDDIDAVKDAGVTSGCGDGTTYCPEDFVTRGQMAAFMNRLGALAADKPPVVNAKTSQSTDGWSLGCPTNTDLAGGLCFDEATRGTATSVINAGNLCADLGSSILGRGQIWKLPTALELRAAETNGDIVISAEEWTSTVYYDDGVFKGISYNGSGFADTTYTDDLPYRCAALPMQRDVVIFTLSPDGSGSSN